MSHFSRSHHAENDPDTTRDEPVSSPSTTNNGRTRSILGDRLSPYQSKNPRASRSDFFSFRGHSRAASSYTPAATPWVNNDNLAVSDSPPISVADKTKSRSRNTSRPLSMFQAYQPPRMDVNQDTIPELQPIFSFLNSHANKLYQEGYFLKLDDQNTQGKPNADRTWTECFAQLVGTVLSLWDAAELDAAGENGEVLPKFINLTDASIKMIDSLPTSNGDQPLHDILSISTAGRNRYLLHFNSKNSLIQWTAGIRLAMFEHTSLQEAYTGALIAGKGKALNNIGLIMERSRTPVEQWVRVRFGAGVPWRRCWCVISPPDEKEYQKTLKEHKKKNPYDRSHPPVLKGDIKFYDQRKEGKKQKKLKPIATINDAYCAYALYPQSKSLIESSTLIKIEGDITIHGEPSSCHEGFVFIMPEVNPAISGFEMTLRFLFPTWDSFNLYGRPGRLVASVLDSRSLMFAMPKHRRYGYLELADVSSLLTTSGSTTWSEREWRMKLKELTGTRMNTIADESESGHTSRTNSSKKPRVGFADNSEMGTPASISANSVSDGRNASTSLERDGEALALSGVQPQIPRLPGSPYPGMSNSGSGPSSGRTLVDDFAETSLDDDRLRLPLSDFDGLPNLNIPDSVSKPPTFSHAPEDKPNHRPYQSPDLRHASSRFSIGTLDYLSKAGGLSPSQDQPGPNNGKGSETQDQVSRQNGSPYGPRTMPPNAALESQTDSLGSASISRPKTPISRPGTATGDRTPGPSNYGISSSPYPNYRGPPPTGPLPGPPGVSSGMSSPGRGRGRPSPNGPPPAHGYPGPGPQGSMFDGTAGRGQPRSPVPGSREPPSRLNSPPIHRKPLPVRSDSLKPPNKLVEKLTAVADSASSSSLTGNRIDPGGFGQIRTQNFSRSTAPQAPQAPFRRQATWVSEASSQYDDGVSTSSPDYASSRPSTSTSSVAERPRAGVLRTVGASSDAPLHIGDVGLDIDFGPTLNYATAPRTLAPPGSTVGSQSSNTPANRAQSPTGLFPYQRTLSGVSHTHSQQSSEENKRRSVIWQPAAPTAASSNSSGPGLSAEEFVQQRVSVAAATPLYAHQRHSSAMTLTGHRSGTTGTSTPPRGQDHPPTTHSRNSSYEYPQRSVSRNAGEMHPRPKSGDLFNRPGSRGAGVILGGQQMMGESHLSAREQEHVARMTGSPLINMAGNKNASPPTGGLVSAIEFRERGREQMKQGWASPAAQSAIQRQQQQQHQQHSYQQYQQAAGSRSISPAAGMYSQGMLSSAPRQQQQGFGMQPRGYATPSPGLEQGNGNWGSGSNGFRSPPPGNMDPRLLPSQSQFSSSPPYSPGSPYQGHAF